MNLKDKVVLVTGSSKGIGEAAAIVFAKEGAKVIVNYRKSREHGERVFEEVKKYSPDSMLISADVSDEEEVANMFADIKNKYGGIDILVNNAGDAQHIDIIQDDLEAWEYQMKNNFFSTVMCSREFLKINVDSETTKKIINISSVWGFEDKCQPNYMAYGASKAAMNSFTKNLAKKYAPHILVNAVAPGYVLTPHWGPMTEEDIKSNGNEQLIQRFITLEEVSDSIIFVAKNDGLTGEVLLIDGGIGLKTI